MRHELMSLAVIGAFAPAVAPACDPRPEDIAAAAARWLVRIEQPDSSNGARGIGLVAEGGLVLTSMAWMQGVESLQIVTNTGHKWQVRGVAGYLSSSNLMLLTVDWAGPPPPPFPRAAQQAQAGAQVFLVSWQGDAAPAVRVYDAIVGPITSPSKFELVDAKLGEGGLQGAATVGADGKVVGLVTQYLWSWSLPSGNASASRFGAPVELLAAAKAMDTTIPLERWPEVEKQIKQADAMRTASDRAYTNGDFAKSLELARACTNADPQSTLAWEALGRALFYQKQYIESLEAARRAVTLDPTNERASLLVAWCLVLSDDPVAAVAETERFAKLAPWSGLVNLTHADNLRRVRRFDDAAIYLEKAEAALPPDDVNREYLAHLREALERHRK